MDGDLAHQAIQAAIKGEWKTAETLNRRILNTSPEDIEALLRLANASRQLGKIKEATTLYEKILKVEPHNLFASRAMERIKKVKRGINLAQHALTNSFLEEPGKTKTVLLVYVAPTRILASLDTGEPVDLVARPHRISVTTENGVYIGRLPDDLSARLLGFIKGGNEYEAAIKSVNGNRVQIFIRETKRSPKFAITPSFPSDDFSTNHEL